MKNVTQSKLLNCLALVLLWSIGIPSAMAIVLLDQEQIQPHPTAFITSYPSLSDGTFRRAQSFTVGLTGKLDHVAMRGVPGSEMRILSTAGGIPTFTILASTSSFSVDANGWINWDLSTSGLIVAPGQILAMEMTATQNPFEAIWETGAGYAGGADYFLNTQFGFPDFTFNPDDDDQFFRTFVEIQAGEVPEPASFFLIAFGFLAYGIYRIRKT
jgi:hypothetical protein